MEESELPVLDPSNVPIRRVQSDQSTSDYMTPDSEPSKSSNCSSVYETANSGDDAVQSSPSSVSSTPKGALKDERLPFNNYSDNGVRNEIVLPDSKESTSSNNDMRFPAINPTSTVPRHKLSITKEEQEREDKLFEIERDETFPERREAPPPPRQTPKKQVSILVNKPPSDEDIPEHKRLTPKFQPYSEEISFDENTPLLSCSSLPTVVGYDDMEIHAEASEVEDANIPMSSSRSEGGHPPVRRKKTSRRRRCSMPQQPNVKIARPLIVSPFMPIVTQRSVEPDRRSLVGSAAGRRETRHARGASYGSVLNEPPPPEASESESESESEESSTVTSVGQKSSFSNLSSRDWVTVIMLSVANLCSTVAFSCIAPFYPQEAALKGISQTQVGIVFGVFELVMFIVSPIFGKYIGKIGSKRMFTLGLAITGITAILFGFLNFIPSGKLFFWASLLVRVAESVGDAAFVTSSFAISAKCFPGSISRVVAIMETFAGLGYTAGPMIGGFLYEYGGFQTPFLVLGGTLLVATVLSVYLIEAPEDEEVAEDSKGITAMLRIPVIWVMCLAVTVCAISLSFLDPTLEAHLRSFNLTPTLVGFFFLLCGGVYTVSAPLYGYIIDRYHSSKEVMFFGSIATAVAMLILGPSPFIPLEKSLVVIGIALAILGLAAGSLYIPTFQNCLDAVKEHGFDDSIYTYGCVSGIFQSAFALGGFFGPTLGGALVEYIGFAWTTTGIAVVNVVLTFCLLFFYGINCCSRRRADTIVFEKDPIL